MARRSADRAPTGEARPGSVSFRETDRATHPLSAALRRGGVRRWQLLVGAATALTASLALIVAIGLWAAGPPIPAKPTAPARQIVEQIEAKPTPLAYRERGDVEVLERHASLPAAWRRDPTPEPAVDAGAAPGVTKTMRIKKGDTLGRVLARAAADGNESHRAIVALRKVFNLRRLRPGQEIELRFARAAHAEEATTLAALTIHLDVDRLAVAEREADGGFTARIVEKDLRREYRRVSGTIEGSLFAAAQDGGLPARLVMELIRIYSWDVDFQREIQPGDRFEVLFDRFVDGEAPVADSAVKIGDILYASLVLSGKTLELFRYRTAAGVDYFDATGASVRKALLRTPVDGARLSSRYGKRRHPILGYTRMHRGIDFAAPRGTPIRAAGNGVVEVAGRNGAYGKYVRIRHNNRYKTAYAHLSRYGRGIRRGTRVKQSQIIGYVGSTGLSTGPHLHYEVLVGGRQVNPLTLKLPTGTKLKGEQLAAFRTAMRQVMARLAEAPLSRQHARVDPEAPSAGSIN